MNDDRKKEIVGRCIYCSAPDGDKYEKLQVFCRNYLTAHPDMPVHLYLDQDIVACHGVKSYEELKAELRDGGSVVKDVDIDVQEIKRCTLKRIVKENVHCGLNVIALGTDSFWGKEGLEEDWKPACSPEELEKEIEKEFGKKKGEVEKNKKGSPPVVKDERLKMRDGTPMVIVVAGCPGSGKSTVGKRISHELKIAFIDKDTVAREISEKAIELQKSYEGDYETNAYGKSIRTAQYKDMGLIAAVNLKLKRSVLITAPFNSQVKRPRGKDKRLQVEDKSVAELLYLNPNNFKQMEWAEDGKIGLYLVWVETSREVELSRLFARDAERDSWKLTHWISHARKQNAKPKEQEAGLEKQKEKLKILDSKCYSTFYNEYDDDMDFEIKRTVKKVKAFCKLQFPCKFPMVPVPQGENGNGTVDSAPEEKVEGKGDFARAIKENWIVGDNERLDCYCADFEPLKAIVVDVVDIGAKVDEASLGVEVEKYVKVCKLRSSGELYHVDQDMPHALVVRGKTIKEKVDMDFISKFLHVNEDGKLINADGTLITKEIYKINQLIFERCTFKRAVSLKKLRLDIAFNNCRFEDSMLIFNREDAGFARPRGNSSRNAILIFRCTALDDCTISEASADVSIVDSELRDVRFNNVEFDRISIYGSTMNTLEVNANCKVGEDEKAKDGCCFWLRDTRIQDAVLLPNVNFDKMNLNGSIINQVRFSGETLESLKRIGDSIKTFRRHDLNNPNELIRRSYVVNTLYTSLSACNYYKQADECLWHARELGYRLSRCGSKYLRKFWERCKYTIVYSFFGGGISLGRLLANYFISTVVIFVSLCAATNLKDIFSYEWRPLDWLTVASAFDLDVLVELRNMLYLAVVSILNINQSLLGCEWLLRQIDAWGWQIVLVMTMGNAYGLVLLAVFMAAIVRKMVR